MRSELFLFYCNEIRLFLFYCYEIRLFLFISYIPSYCVKNIWHRMLQKKNPLFITFVTIIKKSFKLQTLYQSTFNKMH